MLLTAFLLGVLAAVIWYLVSLPHPDALNRMAGTLLAWAIFGAAILSLRRVPTKLMGAVVMAGALLLGAAAVSGPPATSSDSARYAWDGIVQKAGISPYRYVPADPALQDQRPDWLFQGRVPDGRCTPGLYPASTSPGSANSADRPGSDRLCTAINRPQVPTIYPALAEIYFLAVRLVPGPGVGYIAFQLAGLVLSLSLTAGLLHFLRRTSRLLSNAAWWAWSPLVLSEAVNNAHVDVLGAVLATAAVLLLFRGKVFSSGVAFGAAVAVKLIPVMMAPGMLFRRPLRFSLTAALAFVVLSLPYVLISGWAVIGYLPGYLVEEGYGTGESDRFSLVRLLVPDRWATPAGAILLLITAIYIWRTVDPQRPWDKQVVMVGATLLIVSPGYPWYALLLVPLIVLSGRFEYFTVPLALTIMYLDGGLFNSTLTTRTVLGAAALTIIAAAWLRRRRGRSYSAATARVPRG
ncbi:glycosyltransferase family 87 protein [Arthrobacter sp. H35-D1]|uniref:glycosyltransferase family 87 protein n=1 Tax=Arthrobacter sp. H35-D1 TaxID=3046202 RepID=UPI0024B8B98B|nr:glycosyltransferase family 87 protein [Arthrobacter sp. H35-D1]MDJ0313611.1 glycosyltransferase family 87 protein [Arthrobacter sp. H35-D1]